MTVNPSPPSGSALRQRMIEGMTVRGFTAKTQHNYIRCVKTRRLPRPLPRQSHSRGPAPVPGAPDPDGPAASRHQQRRCGAALLLHRDAGPTRSCTPSRARLPAAQAAAGAQPRGGNAVARSGVGSEVQGRAGHSLWRRIAGLRDRVAEGERARSVQQTSITWTKGERRSGSIGFGAVLSQSCLA